MHKPINNYENYIVYNTGKIFSLKSNKFLKPRYDKDGYEKVILYNKFGSKEFRVHRLVAEAFIPNPKHYLLVNHKDENKNNNTVDNLEWCDHYYNNNYGNRNAKIAKAKLDIEGKKVWSLYNNIKIYYNSIKGAARQTGLNSANIRSAIKRKGKCGIYYWGYANND